VADDVAADEQRRVDRHQREVPVADGENTGNVVPLLLSSPTVVPALLAVRGGPRRRVRPVQHD
jgi:hypothetical protein